MRQIFASSQRHLAIVPLVLAAVMALIVELPKHARGQTVPSEDAVMIPLEKADYSGFVPNAEKALLDLLNQTRWRRGLGGLMMNHSLQSTARNHSREMALRGFLGHGSFSSGSFLDRMNAVVPPGTLVGENLAAAATVAQAESALEASPRHLQNILDTRYRSVGIGIATAPIGLIVTEDFTDLAMGKRYPF